MEYRPAYLDRRGYLDVWVAGDGWSAAIELKYFKRALDITVGGERFEAAQKQEAQDISRYDFVKDVERVETVVRTQPSVTGYAVALTNDSSYWRVPAVPRPTIDGAFRLHEGVHARGFARMGRKAGAGTTKGREKSHELEGRYPLRWRDFSEGGRRPRRDVSVSTHSR